MRESAFGLAFFCEVIYNIHCPFFRQTNALREIQAIVSRGTEEKTDGEDKDSFGRQSWTGKVI